MQKIQSVIDTTVSVSISHEIPTAQNITKDSIAFPLPKTINNQ